MLEHFPDVPEQTSLCWGALGLPVHYPHVNLKCCILALEAAQLG